MSTELKIPDVGESIQEVEIGRWLKEVGDQVQQDESVVELETDKASMELPAPASGTLSNIVKRNGDIVSVGETIAYIEKTNGQSGPQTKDANDSEETDVSSEQDATPASENSTHREAYGGRVEEESGEEESYSEMGSAERKDPSVDAPERTEPCELEELVPMSLIRRRIAERLVQARQKAALLTTFNEIDMARVIELRQQCQEKFRQRHGVKLGFMSFFVKATVDALKQFPEINAEVRGTDILYRNYYHVGIAIGSGKGLVVPVLRHAERMSFAEIEKTIADLARRAKNNQIVPDELQGGTFTISNGGIYGSLLSTPILNPPQSGVLGMHSIQERPVAANHEVVIRPMMYVALTYDHRIVDGAEAVTFLKRIKDVIEEPARMLVEI